MISRSVLFALAAFGIVAAAQAAEPSVCAAPEALTSIEPRLERTAERVAATRKLTIVAVGSSSTQGAGATDPARSYPSRLEAELRARLPGTEIRVINRGRGGEDVAEEVARLASDVIAEQPDLVIWQLGTNAVLRRDHLGADAELIRRGLARIRDAGADAVLMDMQYAPRVLDRPGYALMEQLIAEAAREARVGLFPRFALMQYWARMHDPKDPAMVGPDGLHMTDASYGCLAAKLAESLSANWSQPVKAAKSLGLAPDAVAKLAVEGFSAE